jgi:hypothetical protein
MNIKLPPLHLISYADVLESPYAPVDWIVEPLISSGDRCLVFGESSSCKSWLLLDLALHLTAGRKWLGKFNVDRPRSVLYVDEEMGEHLLRQRIRRLGKGANIDDRTIPFQFISHLGLTFGKDLAEELLSAVEQADFDPDIIILETLRCVLDGSENDAEAVAAFWRNVRPLKVAGKTLIVVHHMKKPGRFKQANKYMASGSTYIVGGADSSLAIQRSAGDGVIIENVKNRSALEYPPFLASIAFDDPEGAVAMRFEAVQKEASIDPGEKEKAMHLLEEFLETSCMAWTKQVLAYLTKQGVAQRTGERVWAAYRKQQNWQQTSRGCYERTKPLQSPRRNGLVL